MFTNHSIRQLDDKVIFVGQESANNSWFEWTVITFSIFSIDALQPNYKTANTCFIWWSEHSSVKSNINDGSKLIPRRAFFPCLNIVKALVVFIRVITFLYHVGQQLHLLLTCLKQIGFQWQFWIWLMILRDLHSCLLCFIKFRWLCFWNFGECTKLWDLERTIDAAQALVKKNLMSDLADLKSFLHFCSPCKFDRWKRCSSNFVSQKIFLISQIWSSFRSSHEDKVFPVIVSVELISCVVQ